jgi:hypothetical protein
VSQELQSLSSEIIRTSYQSPWQNGAAERWVGSCRRELLDHVIVFSEMDNGEAIKWLVESKLSRSYGRAA